jgi:hypothetical protein
MSGERLGTDPCASALVTAPSDSSSSERSITETLLDYARPLLAQVCESTTQQELLESMKLVVTIWNAMAVDAWGVGKAHLAELEAAMAGPDAPAELRAVFAEFVRRKRELFPRDLRAIAELAVVENGPGKFAISAQARLPQHLAARVR